MSSLFVTSQDHPCLLDRLHRRYHGTARVGRGGASHATSTPQAHVPCLRSTLSNHSNARITDDHPSHVKPLPRDGCHQRAFVHAQRHSRHPQSSPQLTNHHGLACRFVSHRGSYMCMYPVYSSRAPQRLGRRALQKEVGGETCHTRQEQTVGERHVGTK